MRKRQPLLFETLQNLGLFLLMLLLTGWTADWNDLRYVDVRLLYVVIVAISFGMRQGLLATVLAIASYVAALLHAQIDISYVFYSVESWIPFILYGVAGAFGGYWRDKKYDDYDSLADQYREQGERYDFLKELYREVVDVKNQLQRQIVVSRDSLGRLYSITEELQSPSPRTVCVKTIGVMEDIMECESAALYIHQDGGNFGRLMACSQGLSSTLAPSVDLEKRPKLQEAMERRELYVNTELDPDYPAMAMPICDGETTIGMAVLYQLDPQQYTVYYKNLFQTLTRMIQDNLIRAVRYQRQNWEKLTLPGTLVLTKEAFAQELSALRLSKEELHCPVSVARMGLPPRTPEGTRGSLQGWGMLGREPQGSGDQSTAALYNRAASLTELRDIAQGLFPQVKFYTYVPPSNYLSEEGRQVVAEALPDLQVISGVYTKEGEEGSVYVQDFSVAEDGIAEYPRVTSGMLEDTYNEFAAMNACALYGAFSHFVHPDDILDKERGGGQGWEDLFQAYCDKLGLVNRYFEGLRPLTAVEAGQALRVADALDVSLTVEGDTAAGRCNGFTRSAYCYLRTDKDPQVDNETCRISPVCGGYEGCWYLVEILQPEFSFSLKE